MWTFHLHSHSQPYGICPFSALYLVTQNWRATPTSVRAPPPWRTLAGSKETEPIQLICTLGRVEPGLSSVEDTPVSWLLLCQCLNTWPDTSKPARLWGPTYSKVDFFDGGIESSEVQYIAIHAPSSNQSSHFSHMGIYTQRHMNILGEYVIQYLFSPKGNSTSLHVKSGSRADCWLYAKKWSTYKERVRHDFCLMAAHKLHSDLRDGRPWQPAALPPLLPGNGPAQKILHPSPEQFFLSQTEANQGLPNILQDLLESPRSFQNPTLISLCQSETVSIAPPFTL